MIAACGKAPFARSSNLLPFSSGFFRVVLRAQTPRSLARRDRPATFVRSAARRSVSRRNREAAVQGAHRLSVAWAQLSFVLSSLGRQQRPMGLLWW